MFKLSSFYLVILLQKLRKFWNEIIIREKIVNWILREIKYHKKDDDTAI